MKPNYQAAFNILMDYWGCIPEEERKLVDQKLRIALNEHNSPSKPLSQETHTPPKGCLKRSLERLRDKYGFGIPD